MSDALERMPVDYPASPFREEHEYRYRVAGEWTRPDDVVVDAACGSGYGRELLQGEWVGVDIHPDAATIVADLELWHPPFAFDVFVGLETIEHLNDPTAYVRAAKRARRAIVVSTPIIPTTHENAFHVQDFTAEELVHLFEDDVWALTHFEEQSEVYGIFVFERDATP